MTEVDIYTYVERYRDIIDNHRIVGIPHTEEWKLNNSKRNKGKIYVNDGNRNKKILPEELENYL